MPASYLCVFSLVRKVVTNHICPAFCASSGSVFFLSNWTQLVPESAQLERLLQADCVALTLLMEMSENERREGYCFLFLTFWIVVHWQNCM